MKMYVRERAAGQKSGGGVQGVARPHFQSLDSFLDIEVGLDL